MGSLSTKLCSACHSEFTCGIGQNESACWCNTYPKIMPAEFTQDCRCQSCLAQAISKHIKTSIQHNGSNEMVDIARPYFNLDLLIENIDYTIEQDQYVFSAWYHLKRGTCCGNGCRHCPYESAENA